MPDLVDGCVQGTEMCSYLIDILLQYKLRMLFTICHHTYCCAVFALA